MRCRSSDGRTTLTCVPPIRRAFVLPGAGTRSASSSRSWFRVCSTVLLTASPGLSRRLLGVHHQGRGQHDLDIHCHIFLGRSPCRSSSLRHAQDRALLLEERCHQHPFQRETPVVKVRTVLNDADKGLSLEASDECLERIYMQIHNQNNALVPTYPNNSESANACWRNVKGRRRCALQSAKSTNARTHNPPRQTA